MAGFMGVVRQVLAPAPFTFRLECAQGSQNAVASYLQRRCPGLTGEEAPRATRWLPTGHLQTVWSTIADFSQIDQCEYQRRVIMTPDGGLLSIDISPPSLAAPSDDAVPTVVILHGLTGGSYESYVRNCVAKMAKPKDEGGDGYRCVVLNFRGCANTPVTSPQLYSASKTSDLACAMLLLTRLFPNAPMLAMGFSLGGAILSKYMGEAGAETPFIGAIAVGAPYDLKQTAVLLESTWITTLYTYAMGGNLGSHIRQHANTLALSRDLWAPLEMLLGTKIDPDAERPIAVPDFQRPRKGTLRFVDHVVTSKGGGLPAPYGDFPFPSAEAYYDGSSPLLVLERVARPFLALNADDDPIISSKTLAEFASVAERNPNLMLARSAQGGHLGWFAGPHAERWIVQPISQAVRALLQAYDEQKERPTQGLGSGGPAMNPWRQREISQTVVDVEVLPSSALPSVVPGPAVMHQREDEPQLVWLRTQVLPALPLVHPNDSPHIQSKVPPGRMLSLPLVRILSYPQYQEPFHPEIGYIELPPEIAVGTYIHFHTRWEWNSDPWPRAADAPTQPVQARRPVGSAPRHLMTMRGATTCLEFHSSSTVVAPTYITDRNSYCTVTSFGLHVLRHDTNSI